MSSIPEKPGRHSKSEELHNHHREHQPNNKKPQTPPSTLPVVKSYQPPIPPPPTTSDEEDSNNDNELDSRYECAICIHWLNEPVLTSCGHRFCKSCINSWLRNHNQCCPLDNKKLISEHDIFPDRFTQREIDQIKLKCPNSPQGCSVVASPIEVYNKHLPNCPHRKQLIKEKCPFASVKCEFLAEPKSKNNSETSKIIEKHLKEEITHHMSLILNAFQQTATVNWNPQKQNGHLPPPPPQYANEADENLVKAMYQRIVVLEQRCREQEVKIENISKQLHTNHHQVDPRYSNGVIIWEIAQFSTLLEQMRANANSQVYSRECYTSPYGYKFCARIKVQPKDHNFLSLHVHLMQSENDYHLDWPFKGRIRLCMIHPRDPQLSQFDTIMTNPEILAFHQPCERISARGFGFIEYANISNILLKGFCGDNDILVIKIQVNIV